MGGMKPVEFRVRLDGTALSTKNSFLLTEMKNHHFVLHGFMQASTSLIKSRQ
jgi:hypothetical protein